MGDARGNVHYLLFAQNDYQGANLMMIENFRERASILSLAAAARE